VAQEPTMADPISPEHEERNLTFCGPLDQVALEFTKIVDFMRTDDDGLVFRRFEKLNLYNLLFLQHKLADIDDRVAIHETYGKGEALAELLPKLEPLMKSYSKTRESFTGPHLNIG